VRDLRDRALIATLTYSFARIMAALRMKVEDLRPQGAGWRIQLHEKGGKEHAMPCHHALAEALRAYIDAAGIAEDRKGWLFRTSPRHNATVLTEQPMAQADAWRMIRRRAAAAGILAPIGNHPPASSGLSPKPADAVNSYNRKGARQFAETWRASSREHFVLHPRTRLCEYCPGSGEARHKSPN
jgi:hypothetical protein